MRYLPAALVLVGVSFYSPPHGASVPPRGMPGALAQQAPAASRAALLVQGIERDLRVLEKCQLTSSDKKHRDQGRTLEQRAHAMLQQGNDAEALSLAMAASHEISSLIRTHVKLDDLTAGVEQYRSGNTGAAYQFARDILTWDLDAALRYIKENRDRMAVEGTPLADITDKTLAARCLLETDLAFQPRYQARTRLRNARQLLGAVDATSLTPRFAERWYIAVAGRLQGQLRLLETMEHVVDGVRRFPDDADMLVVAGMFYEMIAPRAFKLPGDAPLGVLFAKAGAFMESEGFYRQALMTDAGNVEAHLRLGRVLAQTGRSDAALSELRLAASSSAALTRIRYLASMFEGAVHEAAAERDAAVASYREAIRVCPNCQSGGIALSHVQRRTGAPEVAVQTLDAAMDRKESTDYWWEYPLGAFWQCHTLYADLRASVR